MVTPVQLHSQYLPHHSKSEGKSPRGKIFPSETLRLLIPPPPSSLSPHPREESPAERQGYRWGERQRGSEGGREEEKEGGREGGRGGMGVDLHVNNHSVPHNEQTHMYMCTQFTFQAINTEGQ